MARSTHDISQYGPHTWSIRYIIYRYSTVCITLTVAQNMHLWKLRQNISTFWILSRVMCLLAIQNRVKAHLGNHFSMATRVSSGDFVFVLTQPSLLHILCTCVSTPIPVTFPHATFMVMWAILGPTPGKDTSSSTVGGISPPYLSLQISVACLMYSALR